MTDNKNVTVSDVVALTAIVGAAQQGARVRWLLPSGDIAEGTARCLAHFGGGFLLSGEDVRDHYLHVSGMMESWLPVADLMEKVRTGEFVVDPPNTPVNPIGFDLARPGAHDEAADLYWSGERIGTIELKREAHHGTGGRTLDFVVRGRYSEGDDVNTRYSLMASIASGGMQHDEGTDR